MKTFSLTIHTFCSNESSGIFFPFLFLQSFAPGDPRFMRVDADRVVTLGPGLTHGQSLPAEYSLLAATLTASGNWAPAPYSRVSEPCGRAVCLGGGGSAGPGAPIAPTPEACTAQHHAGLHSQAKNSSGLKKKRRREKGRGAVLLGTVKLGLVSAREGLA